VREIIGPDLDITSAGRFVPVERINSRNDNAYAFEPSPEAQAYLDEMRRRYGYDIEVRPNRPEAQGVSGYFNPSAKEGGSADPSKRVVYLDSEKPGLYTLMHEMGHAMDPTLLKEDVHGRQLVRDFFERTGQGENIGRPVDYLSDYLFSMGPRRALRAELTAEEAAKFASQEAGLKDDEALRDKAAYPFTYIQRGIEDFERVHTRPNVPDAAKNEFLEKFLKPGFGFSESPLILEMPSDANTVVDASDDYTRRVLDLALDREYQQKKDFEINRAIDYAKRRLGDATNVEQYYR